jgi:hypothetical protein
MSETVKKSTDEIKAGATEKGGKGMKTDENLKDYESDKPAGTA